MMYETTRTSELWGREDVFDSNGHDYYPMIDGVGSYRYSYLSEFVRRNQLARTDHALNVPVIEFSADSPAWARNPRGNDVRCLTYLALIDGCDGLEYYRWHDPMYDDFIGTLGSTTKPYITAEWSRLRQTLQEVNALAVIGDDAMLHRKLGRTITNMSNVTGGTSGDPTRTIPGDEVKWLYREKISTGARYMLCVRLQDGPVLATKPQQTDTEASRLADEVRDSLTGDYTYNGTPKQFTHYIDNMPAATTRIEVLFENGRTITPQPYNGSNGLQFTDGYESRGRHVYKLTQAAGTGTPARPRGLRVR
jgi:hypothetical protein